MRPGVLLSAGDSARLSATMASSDELCKGIDGLWSAGEARPGKPCRGTRAFFSEVIWHSAEAFTALGSISSGSLGLKGQTEAETERARLAGLPLSGLCPKGRAGRLTPPEVGNDDIPSEVVSSLLFSVWNKREREKD